MRFEMKFEKQSDIISKNISNSFCRYFSVDENFTEYFFVKTFVFQRFTIIDISRKKLELNDFAFVVYYRIKFEAKEPVDIDFPLVDMPLNTLWLICA
jgi:hypothetical protein